MITVLLVIHLLIAIAMVATVLLQKSEGGALGIGGGGGGGGGMSGLMTGRAAGNLLTRSTAVLAGAFMITSLTLSLMSNSGRERTSIMESETAPVATEQSAPAEAPAKAEEPAAPLAK